MFSRSIPLMGQTWRNLHGHFLVTITPVVIIHNLLQEWWIMNGTFHKIQGGKMSLTGLGELFKSPGKLLSALHDLQLLISTRLTALSLHKGSQCSSKSVQYLKVGNG